jgi:hypothetical protein
MASKADYEKALLRLKAGLPLNKEQEQLIMKAAKEMSDLGNRVRAALK